MMYRGGGVVMEESQSNSGPFRFLRRLFNNPYFARTTSDRAAFCIVVGGGQLAMWYELFHVLPYYLALDRHNNLASDNQDNINMTTTVVHVVVALFLYINSLANLVKMISTKVVYDLSTLYDTDTTEESKDWAYCSQCCLHRPPRSHHCVACNVCIVKHDHHCWFAGTCVGHSNQRYYLCMIVYMFSAALYSNLFNYSFVKATLGHLGWTTPLCLIAPHFGALLGLLSFHQFLVCVLTFISFLLLIMLTWLLQIQITQLIHGQTKYERKTGLTTYDQGIVGNLRSVLGRRWYIAWLSPWIPSRLPGNGLTFRITNTKSK